MKNKLLLTLVITITSIMGFYLGFMVTKTLLPNKSSDKIVVEKIKSEAEEVPAKETTNKELKTEITPKLIVDKPKQIPKKQNSCPKPKKDYADESYLDVGQDVALDDASYVPSDLVELAKDISKTTTCVKEESATALEAMFAAAKKDGYTIIVSSGFRDYATQKSIVDRETKNGNKNVSIAVAKPGYSEHQLGVAVDLTSKSIAFASAAAKFGDTLDSKWLEDHASEYGFIQSYPKGKEKITGYMYEPWHYRYVGVDNAIDIIKNKQTINEFLKEKNSATKNTP